MKKYVAVAATLLLGSSLAAPFVYPAAWTSEQNTANKRGGEYRVGALSDFKTMNPYVAAENPSIPTTMAEGAGLFTLDPIDMETWLPKMAASMPKVSNGGKRFVVKIRPGMKFSDGHDITADDWVTTAKIHKDSKIGSNNYDNFFVNKKEVTVKKLDKYTLQFDFPTVNAMAYNKMSFIPWPDHVFGPVYKAKGADGIKQMWGNNTKPSEIVSPGMWVMSQYKPGERVTFSKNKYFGDWNKDSKGNPLPYLDRYSFSILSDNNAIAAAFLTGKVDAFGPRNADDLAQIKRAIDNKSLKAVMYANVGPSSLTNYIVFNWNRANDPWKQKLFRDARFRKAMSHLTNRKAMIELALSGMGSETYFSVPTFFGSWIPKDAKTYPYNPAAASKLLAQMGFTKKNKEGYLVDKSGKVLEFTLNGIAGNAQREQMGRIFADDAKKVGVKVNFKPLDFNNLVDMLDIQGADRKFDAMMMSMGGGTLNVWPFSANSTPCGTNLHDYNRPKDGSCVAPQESEITKLYYKGEQTLDLAARKKIGAQMIRLEGELQPMVYTVSGNVHFAFNDRVGGEYPRKLMNGLVGHREIALTFIK